MSAAPSIPTLCFMFHLDTPVSDPKELKLKSKGIYPPSANIQQVVQDILEKLAREYVVANMNDFRDILANLTLSLEQGITVHSCTPNKTQEIKKAFEQRQKCAIMKAADVKAHMQGIKRIIPSLEVKTKATQNFQCPETELVFFDQIAYTLCKAKFIQPISIKIDVSKYEVRSKDGLTTAPLRFPHLLKDLTARFAHIKDSKEAAIGIIGPGLIDDFCPQFAEIYALFPEAEYLLLDANKEAVQLLHKQLIVDKSARYDTLALTFNIINEFKTVPDSYQQLFNSLVSSFSKLNINPEEFKGRFYAKKIELKVPKKVEAREFELITSELKEDEQNKFDILVATLVYQHAIKDKALTTKHIVLLFVKLLKALKKNGCLYMENITIDWLKTKAYRLGDPQTILQIIELQLGRQVKIDKVALSDFQPYCKEDQSSIYSQTILTHEANQGGAITTCSLSVLSLV